MINYLNGSNYVIDAVQLFELLGPQFQETYLNAIRQAKSDNAEQFVYRLTADDPWRYAASSTSSGFKVLPDMVPDYDTSFFDNVRALTLKDFYLRQHYTPEVAHFLMGVRYAQSGG